MNPLLASLERYLHTVDCIDILCSIYILDFSKYPVDESRIGKLDLVLCNDIFRIGCTKLRDLHLLVCQIREEESHADHGVTSVMKSRIYDTSVTLAADESSTLPHLCSHIHLTYGSCAIFPTVPLCNIAQSTGR